MSSFASWRDIDLQVGNLSQYVGTIQKDDAGRTKKTEFLPYFGLAYPVPIAKNWAIFPQTGATLPMYSRDQTNSRKEIYFLGFEAGVLLRRILLKFGAASTLTRVGGSGGVQSLENGSGGNRTQFFLPAEKRTAINFNWIVGSEYFITENLTALGRVIIDNIGDKRARTWSYLLGVSFHFGGMNYIRDGYINWSRKPEPSKIDKKETKKAKPSAQEEQNATPP